jgi:hypothetical protein
MAMGLSVFVIANDFTALTVALAQIEADFGSGVWTVRPASGTQPACS